MFKWIRKVVQILLQISWEDKKNYCTVSTSADGSFIRRELFFHNTKHVTSDKPHPTELEKKQNWKYTQETVISINEVWHHIFKYTKVITYLNFLMIQTTSSETSHYTILKIRQK